jgi:hypothetical protein
MYARYTKKRFGAKATRYHLQEEHVHLFGRNEGFIPWLLSLKLGPRDKEPYPWHVDVVSELAGHREYPESTLLIDLKPKQNKANISLYEVMDVWGYSSNGWSPLMLRLNGSGFSGQRKTGRKMGASARKPHKCRPPMA